MSCARHDSQAVCLYSRTLQFYRTASARVTTNEAALSRVINNIDQSACIDFRVTVHAPAHMRLAHTFNHARCSGLQLSSMLVEQPLALITTTMLPLASTLLSRKQCLTPLTHVVARQT